MRITGVALAGLLALASGCTPAAAPKPAAVVPPAPVVQAPAEPVAPQPAPKKGVGGIARTIEISEVRNMLRTLGLAYATFELTENRAPKGRTDLSAHYENNAKLNEALDKGYFVFQYGVKPQQMPQGSSNTILAYEAVPDQAGMRVVLMGDGSVQSMDEATFNKAPKAGGK